MINYLDPTSGVATNSYTLGGRQFKHLISRLDSLLMVLKSCKAGECHKPWNTLHPEGSVNSLKDALHDSFDTFYADQPKVSFSSCELGYLIDAEGPQDVNVWSQEAGYAAPAGGKQQSFRYQGHWSWWT